ncbi:SGNH/GDSL hydrolase family protein [Nocardiopsis changdeensis]|uniref:SGNH/GDSL hydrolase family protein n=1 Tax=Nocardiopsis changdeensis TaxID=2831969 RepID=A0ABX8BZK4_9ACTN|nr:MULTISPECIES: SGNH/GDSL hydrolase family protein [Nocardiopsis]QUX26256.1 SGNH/GDSL hydrolase family protein [Nocardiopsis changdeensis]QYX40046.1 SGNH/GDSL hydrolase family protein [Nocardiopsis sp. MT53]
MSPEAPFAPEPPVKPRRSRKVALVAAAALGLSLAAAPAAAEEAAFQHYVALGDSFTAGPLIPPYAPGSDPRCLRSSANYAQLTADRLGVAEFTDVSCSGAVTADFSESQFTGVAPQYDALTPDTDLVTVGIGGNDFGFVDVLTTCAKRSLENPLGNPCERHYGDELDRRVDDLRDEISGVYEEIAVRSPGATVLAVGYLQILPESNGCWPREPIARGDVAYLDGVQTALNTMIAEEAAAHGAVFVDVLERGHDICSPGSERWVEGIIPENSAAPVHPNAEGMAAVADRVAAALGAPVA